jgi:hypothetical protein
MSAAKTRRGITPTSIQVTAEAAAPTVSVTEAPKKPGGGLVPLNFRVPAEFREAFEAEAQARGWTLRMTLERAFAALGKQ